MGIWSHLIQSSIKYNILISSSPYVSFVRPPPMPESHVPPHTNSLQKLSFCLLSLLDNSLWSTLYSNSCLFLDHSNLITLQFISLHLPFRPNVSIAITLYLHTLPCFKLFLGVNTVLCPSRTMYPILGTSECLLNLKFFSYFWLKCVFLHLTFDFSNNNSKLSHSIQSFILIHIQSKAIQEKH